MPTTPQLPLDLQHLEGFRGEAYQDTKGIWTIGYGHTPAKEGQICTPEQAEQFLLSDIATVEKQLDKQLSWWRGLSDRRQDAIANLSFNMGVAKLKTFFDFLALLKAGQFVHAAADIAHTQWAKDVGPNRTKFIQGLIHDG